MFEIPVYKVEREEGLEAKIRSSASIALSSIVEHSNNLDLSEKTLAKIKNFNFSKASENDLDLHHLTTILVTTGWNKNDDVFDNLETWLARRTPEDKPLNYEHDDAKIVGHMTSNWVIDDEGKTVVDDCLIDELPSKFHIATGAVLYKCWTTPELQERMDTLLTEVSQGKWFVSMECLFKGFDYAIKSKDGTSRVVARNEKTAFLSKYLKIYGGKGIYNEHKIGRLMRNIIFSGKGFVRDPANPESVILKSETEPFLSAQAQYSTEFSEENKEQVYITNVEKNNEESKLIMTVTVETLQAEFDTFKAEAEKKEAKAKADLDAALVAKANTDELLKNANDKIASFEQDIKIVQASLTESNKKLEESHEELKNLYAEKTKADRVEIVKEKLKFETDKSKAFVDTNINLSDENFNAQVELLATLVSAPKEQTVKANQSVKVETDDDGEKSVKGVDLDKAQANTDVTLSTSIFDSGVNDVQKSIAVALGYKDAAE